MKATIASPASSGATGVVSSSAMTLAPPAGPEEPAPDDAIG